MLAQSFKTAEELGLDDAEHGALIKTLGMLERGDIPTELFDMTVPGTPDCGTAGCILGWARTVGFGKKILGCGDWPIGGLMRLFLPNDGGYSAMPPQAAIALRNYLTTGEPSWAEVMS